MSQTSIEAWPPAEEPGLRRRVPMEVVYQSEQWSVQGRRKSAYDEEIKELHFALFSKHTLLDSAYTSTLYDQDRSDPEIKYSHTEARSDFYKLLSQATLMAIDHNALPKEMLLLERYIHFYLDTFPTRPTITAVVPEVVGTMYDRRRAGDYLSRMLGTQYRVSGWYPCSADEWRWLWKQNFVFRRHEVGPQINELFTSRETPILL